VQADLTTLQNQIAGLSIGAGVGVYQSNGTTFLGKYLGTSTGPASANCRDWVFLDASSNVISLSESDCTALPQTTVWHTTPSCSSPWGASAGANQRITDGVGVYQTGTTQIHMSTTGCPSGSFQVGPGGNSAIYCSVWGWDSGVCVAKSFQLYSVSGGQQWPNDNIGYLIASGQSPPKCGSGACMLK